MKEIAKNNASDICKISLWEIREIVRKNSMEVAKLGNWPAWINIEHSLPDRIPEKDKSARGFDAGIACALGFIPQHAQKPIASLHAAYSPAVIAEINEDIDHTDSSMLKSANSATTWWLAASSLCLDTEGGADEVLFRQQIASFQELMEYPEKRLTAANQLLQKMMSSFNISRGYAYGETDGCQQAAYISGHPFAVMYAPKMELYFIGTFHESLGLEDFTWSTETDNDDRLKSDPVHGSRQFVKCATEEELTRAVCEIRKNPLFTNSPANVPTKKSIKNAKPFW
jgi:hypothetical protein